MERYCSTGQSPQRAVAPMEEKRKGKEPLFVLESVQNTQMQCKHHILTYLLTPCSRVFLEKLTVNFAASQEFPRIYGSRKSLTVPTSARHLSLSWANSIQSPRPPPDCFVSRGSIYIWVILNIFFSQRGVVSTSPNPQAEGTPLFGCTRLLIQFIHSYPPYRRPFPQSATWGRAMPWWQGPTFMGEHHIE
jgi:hypothetical protein